MKRTTMFGSLFILLSMPYLCPAQDSNEHLRSYAGTDSKEDNTTYYDQAAKLKRLAAEKQIHANVKVLVSMLKAIDHNMPLFYPNGPFTRNDFIALAWLESGFTQYEDGTHGERGLFQIMPSEFEDWHVTKNFYNINVNTKMGFRVLNGKYKQWHDYKKAIQAYNGVIVLKNGKWSEKYWKAFYKRRMAVETIFPSHDPVS